MEKQLTPGQQYFYEKDNFINYEIWGTGLQPIVFLHGFGASLQSWTDLKGCFDATAYKLILIDLKGHGFSSKPGDQNYNPTDHAKILISFFESISLKNIILIGHSYGGTVSLVTLLDMMKLSQHIPVQKLILIDPGAFPDAIPFFVRYLMHPFTRTISLYLTPPRLQASIVLRRLFYDNTKVAADRIFRYAFFFRETGFKKAIIKMAKYIIPDNDEEYLRGYASIQIPTLIIWGDDDSIFPVPLGKKLQSLIPASELKIIQDCGHIPQEECADETYKTILDFLNHSK